MLSTSQTRSSLRLSDEALNLRLTLNAESSCGGCSGFFRRITPSRGMLPLLASLMWSRGFARSLTVSVTFVTALFLLGCRATGTPPTGASVTLPTGAPPLSGGHYTDEGEWIPDNKTIARTYKMPDMSAGLMYDVKRIRPSLAVEVFDYRTCSMDVVGSEDFIGVGLSKRWTSIFEIKTGIGVGWDFERGWGNDEGDAGWNFFVQFLMIKF